MSQRYLITATDTDAGKTTFAVNFLKHCNDQGLKTIGLKPLASGSNETPDGLRNDDALTLQAASSVTLPYDVINPIALKEPVAPHLLKSVSVSELVKATEIKQSADITLIEGVGGWLVPLNENETIKDFAVALDIPVILVVPIKLGCLNHALLTYQAMQQSNVTIAGWVANIFNEEMRYLHENINTLENRMQSPLVATQTSRALRPLSLFSNLFR